MSNPYAAPEAVLSDIAGDDETYEPQVFALHGRIGRLRYLAYSWGLMFLMTVILGTLSAILVSLTVRNGGSHIGTWIVMGAGYAVFFSVAFIMAKRRLNDMNKSGWFSLLFFLPLINLFLALYLVFGAGSDSANSYGPRPAKNSVLIVVLGWIMPLFMFIGILSAIALPAYQSYVMKAKAAQAQQQRR